MFSELFWKMKKEKIVLSCCFLYNGYEKGVSM